MTDSDDPRVDGERGGRDAREAADRDEPLGDVAAAVRERSGESGQAGRQQRREGPLADVASAVDERRRTRERSDAFESVEVGELDGERLWDQLADGDDGTVTVAADATESTDAEDDRDVRTIPKATCHGCPHFGDPPELRCTHADADILAMPDTDHFRVADCPMVTDGEAKVGSVAVEPDDAGDATAENAADATVENPADATAENATTDDGGV